MIYCALLSHHPNEFFSLRSHSLLKSVFLFRFVCVFRQALGARKGHVMRERTTVDSPFACAYSLTNPRHYVE